MDFHCGATVEPKEKMHNPLEIPSSGGIWILSATSPSWGARHPVPFMQLTILMLPMPVIIPGYEE